MQVTLNIDAGNLGSTVEAVFQTLGEEDKKDIARQVLREWLREPTQVLRLALDKEALEYARRQNGSWARDRTDDQLRQDSYYHGFMRDHPNPRDVMIKEITTATINHFKEMVTAEVKADPQTNEVLQKTLESVKNEFPRIVNDAMIAWFCGNMAGLAQTAAQALFQSSSTQAMVQQLVEDKR